MDAITKESKEWLAALKLVPKRWDRRPRCLHGYVEPHTLAKWQTISRQEEYCDTQTWEDRPPDITPDLLYAILAAMTLIERTLPNCKGCVPCEQEFHEPELWFDNTRWHCRTDEWAEEFVGNLKEVIIRAAASLQEAKP